MAQLCRIDGKNSMVNYLLEQIDNLQEKYKQKYSRNNPRNIKFSGFIAKHINSICNAYRAIHRAYIPDIIVYTVLLDYGIKNKDCKNIVNKLKVPMCIYPHLKDERGIIFSTIENIEADIMQEMRNHFVDAFIMLNTNNNKKEWVYNTNAANMNVVKYKRALVQTLINYATSHGEKINYSNDEILNDAVAYQEFMLLPCIQELASFTDNNIIQNLDAFKALYKLSMYDDIIDNFLPGQINFNYIDKKQSAKNIFVPSTQDKYIIGSQKTKTLKLFHTDEDNAIDDLNGLAKLIILTIPKKGLDTYFSINEFASFSSIVNAFYSKNAALFKGHSLTLNTKAFFTKLFEIYDSASEVQMFDSVNYDSLHLLTDNHILIESVRDYINSLPDTAAVYDVLSMLGLSVQLLKNITYAVYTPDSVLLLNFVGHNPRYNILRDLLLSVICAYASKFKEETTLEKNWEAYVNSLPVQEGKSSVISDILNRFGILDDLESAEKDLKDLFSKAQSAMKDTKQSAIKITESLQSEFGKTSLLKRVVQKAVKDMSYEMYTQIQNSDKTKTLPLYGLPTSLGDVGLLLTHPENQYLQNFNLFLQYPLLWLANDSCDFKSPIITSLEYTNENTSPVKKFNLAEFVTNDIVSNFLHLQKQHLFATRVGPPADKPTQHLCCINTNALLEKFTVLDWIRSTVQNELEGVDLEAIFEDLGDTFSIEDMTNNQLELFTYSTQKGYYDQIEKDIITVYQKIFEHMGEVKTPHYAGTLEDFDNLDCTELIISDNLSDELMELSELNNEDSKNKCK